MIGTIPKAFFPTFQTEVEIIRIFSTRAGFLATFASTFGCLKQTPTNLNPHPPRRYKIIFFANRQGLSNN
jgi:hypothetical protein